MKYPIRTSHLETILFLFILFDFIWERKWEKVHSKVDVTYPLLKVGTSYWFSNIINMYINILKLCVNHISSHVLNIFLVRPTIMNLKLKNISFNWLNHQSMSSMVTWWGSTHPSLSRCVCERDPTGDPDSFLWTGSQPNKTNSTNRPCNLPRARLAVTAGKCAPLPPRAAVLRRSEQANVSHAAKSRQNDILSYVGSTILKVNQKKYRVR